MSLEKKGYVYLIYESSRFWDELETATDIDQLVDLYASCLLYVGKSCVAAEGQTVGDKQRAVPFGRAYEHLSDVRIFVSSFLLVGQILNKILTKFFRH